MRLPTEMWVKAYLRRLSGAGVFAAIVKRGDADHGTVWIKVARPDRTATLYGPAPESLEERRLEDGRDRRFLRMHKSEMIADDEADRQLRQTRDFDSDLWIVEIEDRDGRHLLDDWLVADA